MIRITYDELENFVNDKNWVVKSEFFGEDHEPWDLTNLYSVESYDFVSPNEPHALNTSSQKRKGFLKTTYTLGEVKEVVWEKFTVRVYCRFTRGPSISYHHEPEVKTEGIEVYNSAGVLIEGQRIYNRRLWWGEGYTERDRTEYLILKHAKQHYYLDVPAGADTNQTIVDCGYPDLHFNGELMWKRDISRKGFFKLFKTTSGKFVCVTITYEFTHTKVVNSWQEVKEFFNTFDYDFENDPDLHEG